MSRSLAQKRANRRVSALAATRSLISGHRALLCNETLRPEECVRIRAAMAELEENLKEWRVKT